MIEPVTIVLVCFLILIFELERSIKKLIKTTDSQTYEIKKYCDERFLSLISVNHKLVETMKTQSTNQDISKRNNQGLLQRIDNIEIELDDICRAIGKIFKSKSAKFDF